MTQTLPEHARLAKREADPALLRLHRALSRLGSVLTVMNTGAHPDDEQNGLLAWLRFGLGMRTIVACSTRGEGGQNRLGPERGGLLGLLRSREMVEAARVIDCDVVWLGFGPEDPVHDFGFSKDGDATFARWGEDLIVERMVRAYRRERPDIVIPTFLDVPGQHGHHRAMTRAAETAIARAADPAAYPEHAREGLSHWSAAKFYLPAWSGGGATYDDTVPPPPATLTVKASARDEATGAPFGEIGEWSRRRHASQGMGRWRETPQAEWPLHLVGGGEEGAITDGLPLSLGNLALLAGDAGIDIAEASSAIAAAQAAFPRRAEILRQLGRADEALERAASSASRMFLDLHGHRIDRKRMEIQATMAEAAGLMPRAYVSRPLTPGGGGELVAVLPEPWAEADAPIRIVPRLPEGVAAAPGEIQAPGKLSLPITVAADAPYSPQFQSGWQALGGNDGAWLALEIRLAGRDIRVACDLETPLTVDPAHTLTASPDVFVLPVNRVTPLDIRFAGNQPPPDLALPDGWSMESHDPRITLQPPPDAPSGLYRIPAHLDGRPALKIRRTHYEHTGPLAYFEPAGIDVLTLDLTLPEKTRIAYIGGGDTVADWMERIGLDVTVLDPVAPEEDFSGYTTVVIGGVAFGARPDLIQAVPALHRFVEAGGHLVTLYQRPDQGWDEEAVPPRRLKIGTPSLRWRVTDPAAAVEVLVPDHPLLTGPNRIGEADWQGWDKERGIYFAAEWDAAYQPLLAMSDAGEAPLTGALLSGRISNGRHTHVSLVLHHQLDRLVPGAFRLLANLVQPVS